MRRSDVGAALVSQSASAGLQLQLSSGEGRTFDRQSRVTIGRGKQCDWVLDSDKLSRVQCVVEVTPSGVFIEDSGSACGTFVNGERVKRAMLREGDRVLIADFVLQVSLASR